MPKPYRYGTRLRRKHAVIAKPSRPKHPELDVALFAGLTRRMARAPRNDGQGDNPAIGVSVAMLYQHPPAPVREAICVEEGANVLQKSRTWYPPGGIVYGGGHGRQSPSLAPCACPVVPRGTSQASIVTRKSLGFAKCTIWPSSKLPARPSFLASAILLVRWPGRYQAVNRSKVGEAGRPHLTGRNRMDTSQRASADNLTSL